MADELWSLVSDCWEGDPARRPTAEDIVDKMREIVGQ